MEIAIGLSRAGLRRLANEMLAEANRGIGEDMEVVWDIAPNGSGSMLTLTFNNDDMEDRDDVGDTVAYWERMS